MIAAPPDCLGVCGGRQWRLRSVTAGKCYMNSSPQWVQILKPTRAKLYCLQDGHRVTCAPQSIHLIDSFACHALRSRLGIFRGFDSMDSLWKDRTIYTISSSMARAIKPVCRLQPGQTAIARRSVLAMWLPSHSDPFQNRRNDVVRHLGHVSARSCHDGCWLPAKSCGLCGCQPGRTPVMSK